MARATTTRRTARTTKTDDLFCIYLVFILYFIRGYPACPGAFVCCIVCTQSNTRCFFASKATKTTTQTPSPMKRLRRMYQGLVGDSSGGFGGLDNDGDDRHEAAIIEHLGGPSTGPIAFSNASFGLHNNINSIASSSGAANGSGLHYETLASISTAAIDEDGALITESVCRFSYILKLATILFTFFRPQPWRPAHLQGHAAVPAAVFAPAAGLASACRRSRRRHARRTARLHPVSRSGRAPRRKHVRFFIASNAAAVSNRDQHTWMADSGTASLLRACRPCGMRCSAATTSIQRQEVPTCLPLQPS
jgi:hypothetical protein